VLTVSLVCGQLAGGSLIDRFGLGPAGRLPITLVRALGVALAVVAVAIGVNGSDGDLHLGLLLLAALAGAGAALQHAAMGHIAGATGEPLAAAVLNFAVGLIVILVVAAAVTGGSPGDGWSAPPGEWLGGVLGATSAVIIAAAVRRLGVLRLTLVLIAGQSVGALVLDFVAPAEGEHVTVLTFVSVLLTIGAVYVSGIAREGAPVSEGSPASRTP